MEKTIEVKHFQTSQTMKVYISVDRKAALYSLLHFLPQIVYCARNPKDTAVSFYHFHRGLGTWMGTLDEFIEDLINNEIMYSPYWDHLRDFWQMRQEVNIFFTTYEDMKRDLRKVLQELNAFLENPHLNDDDLKKLEEHLSFNHMKSKSEKSLVCLAITPYVYFNTASR